MAETTYMTGVISHLPEGFCLGLNSTGRYFSESIEKVHDAITGLFNLDLNSKPNDYWRYDKSRRSSINVITRFIDYRLYTIRFSEPQYVSYLDSDETTRILPPLTALSVDKRGFGLDTNYTNRENVLDLYCGEYGKEVFLSIGGLISNGKIVPAAEGISFGTNTTQYPEYFGENAEACCVFGQNFVKRPSAVIRSLTQFLNGTVLQQIDLIEPVASYPGPKRKGK